MCKAALLLVLDYWDEFSTDIMNILRLGASGEILFLFPCIGNKTWGKNQRFALTRTVPEQGGQ